MALVDMSETYQMTNVGAHIDGTDVYQSNPNLLDNWYFVGGGSQLGDGVFPINQRGQSSYTGGGTQLDRWKTWEANDVITLTANGVKFKSPNGNGMFQYWSEFPTIKTVTFSAIIDGNIYSVTLPEGDTQCEYIGTGFKIGIYRNGKCVYINSQNTEILIAACKLEVGTVSTLANDAPPDFGEELRKCQRYLFIRDYVSTDLIGSGLAVSNTFGLINVYLPVAMRSGGSPTGTFTANPLVYGGGTGEQSSFSLNTVKGNVAKFVASMTSGIANNAIVAYAGTNIRLTISNEL